MKAKLSRMENRLLYNPISMLFMMILAFLLFFVVGFLFLNVISTAFIKIGFTWEHALLVLLLSLLGSGVNIPIANVQCSSPVVMQRFVRAFGVTYKIPIVEEMTCNTLLAVNLGGAVIPALISILLLIQFPAVLGYAIVGIIFVAIITNRIARPVRGVGIVTPALLPPLMAALGAIVLTYVFNSPHGFIFVIAYAGGTLGTLIGSDLLNLGKIKEMGAPVASIGGAGTFDGVFLSGIIAVLLV